MAFNILNFLGMQLPSKLKEELVLCCYCLQLCQELVNSSEKSSLYWEPCTWYLGHQFKAPLSVCTCSWKNHGDSTYRYKNMTSLFWLLV